MIVLVLAPAGSGGAGSISGKVLSRVAERMYARGMLGDTPSYADNAVASTPVLSNALPETLTRLQQYLGIKAHRLAALVPGTQPKGVIPDVRNYDARSALRELESLGVKVILRGTGTVRQQSIAPGTRLTRNQIIYLTLS